MVARRRAVSEWGLHRASEAREEIEELEDGDVEFFDDDPIPPPPSFGVDSEATPGRILTMQPEVLVRHPGR